MILARVAEAREAGEEHETRTDTGLMVLVVEARRLMPYEGRKR